MFAYSTTTSQKECGISENDQSHDMRLLANEGDIQSISTNELQYKHGRPDVRQYDSCFYEIGAGETNQDDNENIKVSYEIQLSVLRAKEMNVYIYGGSSRFNATIPLVKDNEPIETGKTYTIDANDGMLIVAYPNHEVDTEFEFVYHLVPKFAETIPAEESSIEEEPVVVVTEEEVVEEKPAVVEEEEE